MSGSTGRRTREVPSPTDFVEQFAEPLARVLDASTWREAIDPTSDAETIRTQVREAVAAETTVQRDLREQILPLLSEADDVPEAGLFEVDAETLVEAQRSLLYNGHVQAVDGTSGYHRALPVSIFRLGVALVAYHGPERGWQQILFRRDMRRQMDQPREAVIALLERRERRSGRHAASTDPLAELARRGVMSYMERWVLTHEATAMWRMGHGSPAPMELVGTGYTDMVIASIRLVRDLIAHKKFVFVASEQSNDTLFTIGQALHPLEYVVVGTLRDYPGLDLDDWKPAHAATVDLRWHDTDGENTSAREWVARFRDEIATEVVYGLFKASKLSPPQLFYAHREHVHAAAALALADSVALDVRGFPLLIDMADRACRTHFSGLSELADAAYAEAGVPYCYRSERHTRPE